MKPDKKTPRTVKIANLIVIVLAFLVGIGLFNIIRWSFADEDVLKFNKEPIPVLTKKVANKPCKINEAVIAPNGCVVVNFDVCKSQSVQGTVKYWLVNKLVRIELRPYEDSLRKQCLDTASTIGLAPSALPGVYHLEYEVTYYLNPLKPNVKETFVTEEFIVQ